MKQRTRDQRECAYPIGAAPLVAIRGAEFSPRMPELPSFYREVHRLVRRIPRGKVVTYAQVAAMLGRPRAARAVGAALKRLRGPLAGVVPWHRVLNAAGRVSFRDGDWPELQRELLEREGVRFRRGAVDLERVRWQPRGRGVPGLSSRETPRSAGGAKRNRRRSSPRRGRASGKNRCRARPSCRCRRASESLRWR